MMFANLALAKRLEAAEAYACAQFAEARRRLHPASTSAWMTCAGATVVFDGVGAPTTQTFGLGLFEPLTSPALDEIEQFFRVRGYRPFEISNVLYRAVEPPAASHADGIRVRVVGADEAQLWSDINARGWT